MVLYQLSYSRKQISQPHKHHNRQLKVSPLQTIPSTPLENTPPHRPTFAGSCPPTIIGAGVLNFRVRDGIGWIHAAMSTEKKIVTGIGDLEQRVSEELVQKRLSPRPISTGQLNTLLRLHFQPINPVVFRGSYPHKEVGKLILESASRLDAFSAYPFHT